MSKEEHAYTNQREHIRWLERVREEDACMYQAELATLREVIARLEAEVARLSKPVQHHDVDDFYLDDSEQRAAESLERELDHQQ